jgi:hypothetical protein
MYTNGQTHNDCIQRSSAISIGYSVCYYPYPNLRTETIWLVCLWVTVSICWVVTGTALSSICARIPHSHILYNSHRLILAWASQRHYSPSLVERHECKENMPHCIRPIVNMSFQSSNHIQVPGDQSICHKRFWWRCKRCLGHLCQIRAASDICDPGGGHHPSTNGHKWYLNIF